MCIRCASLQVESLKRVFTKHQLAASFNRLTLLSMVWLAQRPETIRQNSEGRPEELPEKTRELHRKAPLAAGRHAAEGGQHWTSLGMRGWGG